MYPTWKCTLCDSVTLSSKDEDRAAMLRELHIMAHVDYLLGEIDRHLARK